MQHIKNVVRIVLLLMVGVSTGVIWFYCSGFLPTELAQRGVSWALAGRIAGLLTVIAMVVAPAIPIQSLFPKHPVAAALAIGWMPMALGLASALPLATPGSAGFGVVLIGIEGGVDWLAIIGGAWAVSRVRGAV